MMERLRAGADSMIVKVILGLIILSFLFAGVGSYLIGGNQKPIAVIGDVEISQNQFEQVYQNERQSMQQQAGEYFDVLMSDPNYAAQFRSSVLERMIEQSLLDQYAKELGLRVSDLDVKNTIREIPAFLSNGIFSNDQYLASLRRNGMTPEQFAELIRQDLVRQQLLNAIQGSEFSLNNELASVYKLEEQTRTIRSLVLSLDKFAQNVKLTDEEKQDYYKKNSSFFVRPEQFKISYVELSGEKLSNSTPITDADIKAYYDANQAQYGTGEKRKVSHIMFEGNDDAAKEKAQKVLSELKSGADFATLAKSRSEDTFSAENGGELDWFDKGVMDIAFEEAAYALKNKGDISDVVKSDFGYHVIKLDDINKSDIKPLAEVKDDIATLLKQQKAAEQFYSLSTTLAEKAFEMPDNLDEAAKAVDLKVNSTDFVSISDLPQVLRSPQVQQALQLSEVREGLNSELIELAPEHVVVVRINETRPETVLPFAEVSEKVTTLLKNEKAQENMTQLAKKLVKDLNAGKTTELKASGYSFGKEEKIKRNGQNRELIDLAFTMTKPEKTPEYSYTENSTGNILIVELKSVTEPSTDKVDLKALLSKRVEQSFANADLYSIIGQLKQKIKITNNLNQVESNL